MIAFGRLLEGVALGCAAIASRSDLRNKRIPNVLTASVFLFALVLAPGQALLGAGVFVCALLAATRASRARIGGGDWKLAGALGACLGPAGAALAFVGTVACFKLSTPKISRAAAPFFFGGTALAIAIERLV